MQLKNESYFLGRVPALPFETFDYFNTLINKDGLAASIRKILDNTSILDSIQKVSPSLYNQYIKWNEYGLGIKEENKMFESLIKYLVRMCTRPTPFDDLAGVFIGHISNSTEIKIETSEKHLKQHYLEMECLEKISNYLSNSSTIRPKIKFHTNNSLFIIDEYCKYVEYKDSGLSRVFTASLVEMDNLREIIEIAKDGCYPEVLSNLLVNEEISIEEAKDFIDELIDNQILISELQLKITEQNNLQFYINFLHKVGENSIANNLEIILKILDDRDLKIEERENGINSVMKNIIPNFSGKCIRTDLLIKTKQNTISASLVDEIGNNIEELIPLFLNGTGNNLLEFKKKFRDRYGEQEMPLSIVLDDEFGIGYESSTAMAKEPLIKDLFLKGNKSITKNISWDLLNDLKINLFHDSLNKSAWNIELSEKHLGSLNSKNSRIGFSESIGVFGQLIDNFEGGASFKFLLKSCAGPSSSRLMARFSNNDSGLKENIYNTIKKEESFNSDILLAEIIHYPNHQAANISSRPSFYEYEIECLSRSSLEKERVININDLMISLEGEEILLRSKRLNKRVLPRLSSAHNYHNHSLGIYKFLCELQNDNRLIDMFWDWGILEKETFLPRVTYKKIILSPARWRLRYEEIVKGKVPNADSLEQLIQKFKIPKYVLLTQNDNELLLDLSIDVYKSILLNSFKEGQDVLLVENFYEKDCNIIKGDKNQTYTNELIFPFVNNQSKKGEAKLSQELKVKITRDYLPGSEWLYIKIYMGIKTTDTLLSNIIEPFVSSLLKQGKIKKWFFIRYFDTDHHLRLRFNNPDNPNELLAVLNDLNKLLVTNVESNIINKVTVDTYQREIERYGVMTMDMSEDIFFYDSEAVLKILTDERFQDRDRWIYSVYGINAFLDDFGFSLYQKKEIMSSCEKAFFREFGANTKLKNQLNNKFREKDRIIKRIIINDTGENNRHNNYFIKIFSERSKKISTRFLEFEQLNKETIGSIKLQSFVISHIHMFMNRLFNSNQRIYELVIYSFLFKTYSSSIALKKGGLI